MLDLRQPERKMRRVDHLRRTYPEYRLTSNESKALTNDNALTELAVRSSLSGRFCDAGCNTTSP
jgi:hypothetical protein